MKRDLYWDSLKFVLICFVVYGHVIEQYAPDGSFNRAMWNFIYTFHMPLFIFVSGRFSHIHSRENYIRGIFKLLETYIVFQIIWTIVRFIHSREIDYTMLTQPYIILWYLVSLSYWRFAILILSERLLSNKKQMIWYSLLISLAAGFVPLGKDFSIQRTFTFLPFFLLGYYSIDVNVQGRIKKIPPPVAIIIIIVLFAIIYLMLNINLSYVLCGSFPYYATSKGEILMRLFCRLAFICFAILISPFVMRLIPVSNELARYGQRTMHIFIYHFFVVSECLCVLIDKAFLPQNEIIVFVYAISIVMFLLFLSRFRLFEIMLNPITFFVETIKANKL